MMKRWIGFLRRLRTPGHARDSAHRNRTMWRSFRFGWTNSAHSCRSPSMFAGNSASRSFDINCSVVWRFSATIWPPFHISKLHDSNMQLGLGYSGGRSHSQHQPATPPPEPSASFCKAQLFGRTVGEERLLKSFLPRLLESQILNPFFDLRRRSIWVQARDPRI